LALPKPPPNRPQVLNGLGEVTIERQVGDAFDVTTERP
jgi:hypothetical protein